MCSTTIPSSFYEAKWKLCDLGLGYETIHACKYNWVLYLKEFGDLQHCPTYGESRYKVSPNRRKKILHKVLRYFPSVSRLQGCLSDFLQLDVSHWKKSVHFEFFL